MSAKRIYRSRFKNMCHC